MEITDLLGLLAIHVFRLLLLWRQARTLVLVELDLLQLLMEHLLNLTLKFVLHFVGLLGVRFH